MDVGGRRYAGRIGHKLTNSCGVQRMLRRQQMSQRIGDGILTFASRKFQNLHVHFVGHFFRMRCSQRVPRHAKTARRKHFFAILIVGESTRFSHQRINDVAIINGRLVLADNARHRLNQMTMMSHRNLFSTDAKIDELTNQATRYRIGVGAHVDRAAATDANALDDVVRVEHCVGQSLQMSKVIKKLPATILVGSFDQIFHEGDIRFASIKIPTAAQHQRLIDTILEMSVGGFHVSIFVGTAGVRAFRFAVVVTHQGRIAFGQFATTRVISHGGGQRITAMPFGYAAKVPERFLNAGTERFERLRKTKRHALDVAVREYAVEKCVIESPSCNLHAEFIAHREVTGGQSSWVMLLIKEDRLAGTMQTSPLVHAPFKGATSGIRKLCFVSLLQPFEKRLRFEPRFQFEPLLDFVPDVSKGIAARTVVAI